MNSPLRTRHIFLTVPLLALGNACQGGASAAKDVDKGDASSTGDSMLAAPLEGEGVQLEQTYAALPPGGEVHYCQLYQLPNVPMDVARFEHTYTKGGHHVILYPTDLHAEDVAAHPSVFDCVQEMPNRGNIGFSYVNTNTHGEQAYPEGVAWHFEPGEVVMLESHMLNLGDVPLDVDYRVNLWFAKRPVKDHVGTIFFYDNNIFIPASGKYTARMNCNVPADIHVVALAPHMHVRGTHFTSALAGGALPEPKALAASDDWAVAESTLYNPPLDVTAGQHFEVSCDYENPSARAVVSGGSKTNNEMCLLIGSYYPKLDFPFEFCMGEGSGPVYEGQKTCGDTLGCFVQNNDPFSVASQECVVGTCEKSSRAFNDFFSCVGLRCFFPGLCQGDGGSNCAACAVQNCTGEMAACQQTGCN